ncbi:unnamed protein product [Closterium sp. Naga37s-1]|nr:unnamed protein product [Closterium sp. Naga37s-1]
MGGESSTGFAPPVSFRHPTPSLPLSPPCLSVSSALTSPKVVTRVPTAALRLLPSLIPKPRAAVKAAAEAKAAAAVEKTRRGDVAVAVPPQQKAVGRRARQQQGREGAPSPTSHPSSFPSYRFLPSPHPAVSVESMGALPSNMLFTEAVKLLDCCPLLSLSLCLIPPPPPLHLSAPPQSQWRARLGRCYI